MKSTGFLITDVIHFYLAATKLGANKAFPQFLRSITEIT